MDINRKLAFEILVDIEKNNAYSNLALNRHLTKFQKDNKNESLKVGFIRELVYGVLENKLYFDYVLEQLIPKKINKNRAEILTILRLAIFQIENLNSVPDYAAVDESMQIANKFYKNQAGFVNGVLRNYLRNKDKIYLDKENMQTSLFFSIKYSHAKWIIDYWLKFYKEEFVEALLIENNKTPKLCIRANTLKISRKDLINKLTEKKYEIENGSLVPDAIYIKGNHLLDEDEFTQGEFSVQDESSMFAVNILDPMPKDVIIDVCAAPGGKTLHMAEKMNNQGEIVAFDIHEHKLNLLEKSAAKNNIEIISTRIWNSKTVNEEFVNSANKVLVDAPCSGLGVLRRKPELKYKGDYSTVLNLSKIQEEILESSSKYLINGGILLYSTCTISEVENQGVVAEFIKKNPEFEIIEERQLFPNVDFTDGFYICKMQKKV